MPAPISIHHIAVTVQNTELSARFYREVFGLSPIARDPNAGNPQGAWFSLGSVQLHLQDRPEKMPKTDQHFAVVVEDLAGVMTRARELGGRVKESRPLEGFSQRAFVYDLDDNRIEVLEK
jgi:catechol 2,3-dioxygenase-like lactoylglutathione lyase family enzyme